MRSISITNDDGVTTVLGDDNLPRGAGSKLILQLLGKFDAALDRVNYVRGEAPENFDRLNESTSIVAVVAYEFSSIEECSQFVLDLGNNIPRIGRVRITTTTSTGASTRYLSNAWGRPVEVIDQSGVSCVVRFNFTGGKVTRTP